jgi:hypothetical protein
MIRFLVGALALALGTFPAVAQSLDDLNIQFHGYATQGFLYTNDNNMYTARTSDGSPAWTEAVVNLTAQPMAKLRIGAQGRFFLLGNYGDGQSVTLDWASADYKFNDRFGVRVGKVKTPWGLFNEVQDIDPSYIWNLLPQSIYPLADRAGYLTHYGGIVYGTLNLHSAGKLEYRGWGGEGYYPSNDGYYKDSAESGYALPDDIHGVLFGGALHWKTPFRGLMVGASDLRDNRWSAVQTYTSTSSTATGSYTLTPNSQPNFFAMYDRDKIMVAFEYERSWGDTINLFPTAPAAAFSARNDDRSEYGMATYKVSPKLTAGAYWSGNSDHQAPLNFQRYSKDWVISGRYDFNQFLYAKAEQHFIHGAGISQIYDLTLNSDLKPNTRLTALKIGVSF